jgi:excisionase family DNA binding protein
MVFAVNGIARTKMNEKPNTVQRAGERGPVLVDKLLTIDEVATRLRIHANTVSRYIKTGQLKSSRMPGGRTVRIRQSWVDEFLNRQYDQDKNKQHDPSFS